MVPFAGALSTTQTPAQFMSKATLNGLVDKLEDELAKAVEYTELAWGGNVLTMPK